MSNVVQIVSVLGAALVLLGFVAVQRDWWTPEQRQYLWANLVGSALLAAVAIWDRRLGFVILEVAWAGVSFWSLVRPKPPEPAS